MRQQAEKMDKSDPYFCISDFIAPKDGGVADYIGLFAVNCGIGADALADQFLKDNDDYNNIMVKALADRLAGGLQWSPSLGWVYKQSFSWLHVWHAEG